MPGENNDQKPAMLKPPRLYEFVLGKYDEKDVQTLFESWDLLDECLKQVQDGVYDVYLDYVDHTGYEYSRGWQNVQKNSIYETISKSEDKQTYDVWTLTAVYLKRISPLRGRYPSLANYANLVETTEPYD